MLKKTVLTFAFLSILTTFYGFNAQTGTPVTDPSPVLEPAPKSVGTNALAKERLCVISPFDNLMRDISEKEGNDWRLMAAIAYHESRFTPDITSSRGACGLMQIMPSVAEQFDVPESLIADPATNVWLANKLLSKIGESLRFPAGTSDEDRMSIILACYNGGIGHVNDARRLARVHGEDPNSWEVVARYLTLKSEPEYYENEVVKCGRSNACFWLDEYHIDALRVDAVSSMLYLDYSRKPGQWHPNIYGGRENLEAIDFLKEATATAYKNNPGIMMIAEESTAYPGITAPTDAGGLGFGLKWNMGWMHDTLQYLHEEPINRKWHHNEITFSMVYAYSEHYVLPISHDEVVYGKGSLFGKMPGDDWQRYAGVRALFAYQWAHPGKKLSFMGNEVAQYGEWDHDGSVDWDALNWPDHRGVQKLVADLNTLYKASPALWSQDFDPAGFQWLTSDDADHNTLSFVRIGKDGEQMVVVVNFSGEAWEDYQVPLTKGGKWTEVLTTDDKKYGGSDIHNGTFKAVKGEYHSRDWSAKITVPALGAVFLKPEL